jgi:two-component system, chemotaxis family, CheB/CheR fusion protein
MSAAESDVQDQTGRAANPHANLSFPIAGIGASAGGLEAFTELVKHLPSDTGMSFILVQHLDPAHESALPQILARATSLPVREITDQLAVEPDHIYVIPRDTSLRITDGILRLGPRQKIRVPHRPIDTFFESLAQDRRNRAIGIVLSGTASDGTQGLEAIKAEGGITFAQDNSAKYDSMPRSAVAAGCVDLVLSPAGIAGELTRIARHPYVTGQPLELLLPADSREEASAHERDDAPLPSGRGGARGKSAKQPHATSKRGANEAAQNAYRKILSLLHTHSGVDFTLYKSTTIQRRITRRLLLSKLNTLEDYADCLRGNAQELDALYSDVLISVTSFFRNPEVFEVLQRKVLPALLKQRGDDPLRCWVLGCSTGQEAYSIAMAFVEVAEKAPRTRKLQIFATDLNEALLDKARQGLYAKSLEQEIAPERLRRFFVEEQGGYRISKPLREMVVFARQNLISDPPFSRMDLISCRNVLIYLEPGLQKKAIPTFHYALKPNGFLLLGSSESIGGFTDLFEPVDKKQKVFSRKAASTPSIHLPFTRTLGSLSLPSLAAQSPSRPEPPGELRNELSALREADRITVNQFAPPGVLINAELQVMQFRGAAGTYLEPPPGKASFDVLKMAREGLMLPLRSVINQAKKSNKTARKENVRFVQDGRTHAVNLEVIPLKNLRERCYLILFEEPPKTRRRAGKIKPAAPALSKKQERSRIADLETEIAETREYLQSVQDQHEAAIEELQAANEEVQSANEELQSVNEELETSKEELESANEELITVNEEMNNRNSELSRLNNDLMNLQASIRLAILLLGRDLTVRRFSPQAQKQFDLQTTDIDRPVGHIRHGLSRTPVFSGDAQDKTETADRDSPVDLEGVCDEVIADVQEREYEVHDRTGRCYLMRVRPYMTSDNKVDGAVLVLVDIDALKRGEQAIADARDYAENTVATLREPLLVLDKDLRIESANRAFYRAFRATPQETLGKFIYELGSRQWDIPRLHELLGNVLQRNTTIEGFRVEHQFATLGPRIMLLNARRVANPRRQSKRILLAIEDITERSLAEEKLRESHAQLLAHMEELDRFNRAAVGRELRMIELKKEVNALSLRLGQPAPYALEFEHKDADDPETRHKTRDG